MSLSIVFMGTPEFAVPTLIELNKKYNVKAVVTATDKPQGRGHKVLPSPVKKTALELGLQVLQPENLKDSEFIETLKSINPDIIVVVAFRILPREVFTIPRLGCFNIHASLLPKYRGAAPINWAIINGEKITGLTSFLIQEKVDTGNILLQTVIPISEGATSGDLHDLMAPLAARLAIDTCELLARGNYKPIPQDESLATSAPKIYSHNAKINFDDYAEIVRNFIHGYSPVPGAWTIFEGKKMKIFRADYEKCSCSVNDVFLGLEKPGEFLIEKGQFCVKCKAGFIFIKELQIEGKKVTAAADFINGYKGEKKGMFQ